MNLRCILRWMIYTLGLLAAILSIFCFVADENDNSQATNANPNAGSKKVGNFLILIFSVLAVVPLFFHFMNPKLFYILIYIVVMTTVFILRIFLVQSFHFMYQLAGLTAVICATYYFWLTMKEMISGGGANDSMVQRLTKGEPKQAVSDIETASNRGTSKIRSSKGRSSKG